jgi:hypothetical protein
MSDVLAHFDTGLREQISPNHVWHGSAWITADGTLRIHGGPNLAVEVDADGETAVYYDGRRSW